MKFILKFIFIILLFFVGLEFYNTPLVINMNIKHRVEKRSTQKEMVVNPLKEFDFSNGNWKSLVVLSPRDYASLPIGMKKCRFLKLEDKELLTEMQDEWDFVYTGGDMATYESEIYFIKDNDIMFYSGLNITKHRIDLQNREFGYLLPLDSNAIIEYLTLYQSVYSPFIVLW